MHKIAGSKDMLPADVISNRSDHGVVLVLLQAATKHRLQVLPGDGE